MRTALIWLRIWARFGALVSMVMKLQTPQKAGNFFTSWATISKSRTLLYEVGLVYKKANDYENHKVG
jgi:hypothetical protein